MSRRLAATSGACTAGGDCNFFEFGRAFLVGRDLIKEPRYHVEADDVDSEVARLRKAIASSDKQLAKIKSKLAEEEASSDFHIITAHQLMLHDEHLVDATIGYIKDELINAEWALTKAVGDIRGVFDAIEDDYFRERRSDVDFVGERVLRNLLSNAYKYSPEGGPIVVTTRRGDLNGLPAIGVRVSDRGIGMTPDQVGRAFERFYRADPSGNIPGTGLGLCLVKEIVEIDRKSVV